MGLEPPWKKNFPQKSFFIPLFLNNRYINRYYFPDKDFMVPYFSGNFIFHPYETKFCGIEKWYAGTEKWYAGTEKWYAGTEKWMTPGLKSGQPKK